MRDPLQEVMAERARQDVIWGEQNHDPFTWLAVLVEENGEAAEAALNMRFGGMTAAREAAYRKEVTHATAVGLAMLECLDRGKWTWPAQSDPESTGDGPDRDRKGAERTPEGSETGPS